MRKPSRAPITTHVLDLARGGPAARLPVTLERLGAGRWKALARSRTDADGRVEDLLPAGKPLPKGNYRLTFDTRAYYRGLRTESFYPSVTVNFTLTDPKRHHHVPLLLNAFGYSTYRGT